MVLFDPNNPPTKTKCKSCRIKGFQTYGQSDSYRGAIWSSDADDLLSLAFWCSHLKPRLSKTDKSWFFFISNNIHGSIRSQ